METVQDDFFSSPRLQQDWKAAEPNPELLTNAKIDYFSEKMRLYYKHSENQLYKILNFDKLQIAQTKHLVHFTTTLKLQEKLVRFVAKKTLAKPTNTQYGTN